jgi:hypothetical protein
MLILEITEPQATVQPTVAPVEEIPQDEIADVKQLLSTIDPTKEKPESLLNKLTSWMSAHPLLDKITDIIPQTRMVKAIAAAVDAIESGDKTLALSSLATVVGGSTGKQLAQLSRGANTVAALQQGDLKGAALAQGGNIAKMAQAANAVNKLNTALTANPAEVSQNSATAELDRIKQLSSH